MVPATVPKAMTAYVHSGPHDRSYPKRSDAAAEHAGCVVSDDENHIPLLKLSPSCRSRERYANPRHDWLGAGSTHVEAMRLTYKEAVGAEECEGGAIRVTVGCNAPP